MNCTIVYGSQKRWRYFINIARCKINGTGMKFGKHISTNFRPNHFSVRNYLAKLLLPRRKVVYLIINNNRKKKDESK